MAILQSYFRIITPKSKQDYTKTLTDYIDYNSPGFNMSSSATFYSQVLKGAGTRMQRYIQFDSMDTDIDISRALDIIAEECSNDDDKTNLPFEIEYQVEDDEEVNETIVTTIRAAVRKWNTLQDFNNRIFRIARTLIKYGDCFFKKSNDLQKWEYIDPSKVIGIEIDKSGNKVAYHLKGDGGAFVGYANKQAQVEVVPAAAIIHFTLSDEMGESMPFGESILQAIFRTFKQLSLLEDSVIIYRLVRAPERRVFYIDVGNMPPQRVKGYLEQIKNELRQKRTPNTTGGKDVIDGTYDPACLALDEKIPLLDGRTLTLLELIEEHNQGKQNWVYSCNPDTGEIVPGIISWAGVTRTNTEVLKLTLDNGKEVICTPDHKFPIQGKGFVRADELLLTDSLIPFNTQLSNTGYEEVFDISKNKWIKTHRIVKENIELDILRHKDQNEHASIVHHKDFNKLNNTPNNLVLMGKKDHFAYHCDFNKERFNSWDGEKQKDIISKLAEGRKNMTLEKDLERQKKIITGTNLTNRANGKRKTERRKSERLCSLSARLNVSQEIKSYVIDKLKTEPKINRNSFICWMNNDERFLNYFKKCNTPTCSGRRSKPTYTFLNCIVESFNMQCFQELKLYSQQLNHKIVKIEKVENRDVGCITIDGNEIYHNFHTFALDSGIFTKNSISEDFIFPTTASGRQSRVETLPGGENLGEMNELKYFRDKLFRGLRIPSSYFAGQDQQQAQYNDGKVGLAYIEELRFANFIRRIQNKLESEFDKQFKLYIKTLQLNIEEWLFLLKLPEPQNFGLYRKAALDSEMINTYKSIEDVKLLSARWKLKQYLGLSEDDLQMNEKMLKEELGIDENANISDIRQIYDPIQMDARTAVKVKNKHKDKEESGGGDMGGGDLGGEDMGGAPDMGGPDLGGGLDQGLGAVPGGDDFGNLGI
jgi:hypothetical protein